MTEETDPGIPKLYYVSEIAKVWQVEKRWIMARIHDGRFEAVKMANGWAMTHGQMSAALESISNQDKRKQRTEREEWKPPHGIPPGHGPITSGGPTATRTCEGHAGSQATHFRTAQRNPPSHEASASSLWRNPASSPLSHRSQIRSGDY